MAKLTGVSLLLHTSAQEIKNAKDGATTIIAYKVKTKDSDIQITVAADACDVLENEVRVNLAELRRAQDEVMQQAGAQMGAAIGAELEKVFAKFGG